MREFLKPPKSSTPEFFMPQRYLRLAVIMVIVFTAVALLVQQQRLLAGSGGGTAVACQGGMAGIYPCDRVDLISFTPKEALGATITESKVTNPWGWTDPETGKEYVMMGMQEGVAFVDISQPLTPTYLGILPTHYLMAPLSEYRDMKVYQNYAFIIADYPSQNGLQIFDLTTLRHITTPTVFSETAHYDGIRDGHHIYIHQETGYVYIPRRSSGDCATGTTMINIQDPLHPTSAGCFAAGGVASDVNCVIYHGPDADYQGREICTVGSDDNLMVGDVTSKTAPVMLSLVTYPSASRIHSARFTEDQRYIITADMEDEHHHGYNTRIYIWDATDLDNIPTPTFYTGPTTGSDHMVWIQGDFAYISNLGAGVRILDLRRLSEGVVTPAAYFDNYPVSNAPGHYHGTWAVYPYFESGVLVMSDREEGLFLLRPLLHQTFLPVIVK